MNRSGAAVSRCDHTKYGQETAGWISLCTATRPTSKAYIKEKRFFAKTSKNQENCAIITAEQPE